MIAFARSRRGAVLIAVLLVLQVFLLWLSWNALYQISIFCTAPASSGLGTVFGLVHLSLMGLLIAGTMSLGIGGLRLPYAAMLAVCLVLLGVQAYLVSQGVLWCDAP